MRHIIDLGDHHVPAVAAPPFDVAAASSTISDWRDNFEHLRADRPQRVLESELLNAGVRKTRFGSKNTGDLGAYFLQVRSNHRDLTQSHPHAGKPRPCADAGCRPGAPSAWNGSCGRVSSAFPTAGHVHNRCADTGGGPHDSVARRMAKVGQRARGHFGNYVRAHAPQSDARTTACHATITAHTESNPQQ